MELEVARDIDAPAEVVWEIVTDLDASPSTLSNVTSIERLDDGDSFTVGTRWRETRTMLGREATEELEVIELDAGRSYTVRTDRGKTVYTSVVSVTPSGPDTCRLRMTFDAEASGLGTRLLANTLGRAFQGATRRALEQDLADIAAVAEQRHRASN